MTAPTVSEEVLNLVRRYRTVGLPCHTAFGKIRLRVGGRIWAVTIPWPRAAWVVGELADQGLSGPIVAHERTEAWTLIASYSDDLPADSLVKSLLAATRSKIIPPGAEVPLPSPQGRECYWPQQPCAPRWLTWQVLDALDTVRIRELVR